jgi:NAD(P)-dependent dehydrogenase (short-subunit alcohol dehydrogenase family)
MASSLGPEAPTPVADHSGGPSDRRVAIITGASRGIGAGLAAAYTSAGYAVVGTALTVESSSAPNCLMLPGDIGQAETAERVVQKALEQFGRIDTLINNAGIFIGKPFIEYTADDYTEMISVNLTGFFHITRLVIKEMLGQGGGHVVNMSTSLVEHPDPRTPSALASLTKGGLEAVTRSLSTEYAKLGIRVNAVALGIIKTRLEDPASYASLVDRHPLGRVGEVSDVVDAILYLEGAGFVTGEILHVDGGRAAGG